MKSHSRTRRPAPRVLIFTEWFFPSPGGSERVAHNLALDLHRRGWRPVVYARQMAGSEAFDARQPYPVIRSALWSSVWNLNRAGAGWSRIGRILTAPVLLWELGLRRWDALVAIHLVPLAFVTPVLRLLGRPVCVWALGEEIEMGRRSASMRFQVKTSLKTASTVFAISRVTADHVVDLGVPLSRIVMEFPCPDRSFFAELAPDRGTLRRQWLSARRGGEEPLLFVTISRLAERKGIDTVLRALAELKETESGKAGWVYLIGGTGEDKPRLRKVVEELGLGERVAFLGSLEEGEKRDLIEAADLFLMPNRRLESGEQEGFGIVFVEAALRGTPSVGGRSGGTADALEHGVSGWLVKPDDSRETRDRLEEVLGNPSMLEAMRPSIRRWAMKKFLPHLRHKNVRRRLLRLIRNKK